MTNAEFYKEKFEKIKDDKEMLKFYIDHKVIANNYVPILIAYTNIGLWLMSEYKETDWSEVKKGTKVNVSDINEDPDLNGYYFYKYDPNLKRPFLVLDDHEEISCWRYCKIKDINNIYKEIEDDDEYDDEDESL